MSGTTLVPDPATPPLEIARGGHGALGRHRYDEREPGGGGDHPPPL